LATTKYDTEQDAWREANCCSTLRLMAAINKSILLNICNKSQSALDIYMLNRPMLGKICL